VGFLNGNDGVVDGGGERCDDSDGFIGSPALTSYLSPTPRKATGRTATPFHTPLSSALKTVPEETIMNGVAWGAAEMPGKRIEMEDAILCQYPLEVPPKLLLEEEKLISPLGLFGVFDGHGDGGFASQFISSNLISKLQSNPNWNVAYNEINSDNDSCSNAVLETVFTEAYYDLDKDLKDEESKPRDGGTTAIVALLSGQRILVANVGDSRCILVKKRAASKNNQNGEEESIGMSQIEVLSLSEDHKPDLPDERARIESAGLAIHIDQIPFNEDDKNGQYVMISKVKKSDKEMLGVARAFGDYDYKSNEELSSSRQAVVCTPDFVVMERADSEDMFLILACDGVFDVMSNDEVGLFVTNGVNAAIATLTKEDRPVEAEVLASVGDGLLAECLEKGSTDNMSVLIVALPASGLSSHGKLATARTLAFG
jgi:serine/threonine protein phosphatase PrpC